MDTSKQELGILCKRGHEHIETGQSLRWLKGRGCVLCQKLNAKVRRRRVRDLREKKGDFRGCVICEKPVQNRKAVTCSYVCGGLLQRRDSEVKYRLDAFEVWSPDMSYALGLLYSDGSLSRSEGSWRIQFNNTDLPTVEWFHKWIGNPGKISVTAPQEDIPVKPHWKVQVRRSNKTRYKSTTTSDTLGERLLEMGVRPQKSRLEISLPSVPEEVQAHFMRGVFDGDGGIWFGKQDKMKGGHNLCASLTCAPEKSRRDLGNMLQKHGVGFSESEINLCIRGSQAEYLCSWLYASEGPRMTRKEKVWQQWCDFRKEFGGLISELNYMHDHSCIKGLQPKGWHALIGTMSVPEVARRARVGKSRVYQVRKILEDVNAA